MFPIIDRSCEAPFVVLKQHTYTFKLTHYPFLAPLLPLSTTAIFWFILLIAIAWPVAFLCAVIWVFIQVRALVTLYIVHVITHILHCDAILSIQPFEACCSCAGDCGSVFERYAAWPRDVGDAIANCRSGCPQP